jgi:tRNA threonylcarbamoyladenosine modification (KEOPS) complex  Pcc1 subunit
MFEAEISIRYPSHTFAISVMKALSPDNLMPASGMRVVTSARGGVLRVRVERCERIESLQATVQDVFRCLHAAESSLARITTR